MPKAQQICETKELSRSSPVTASQTDILPSHQQPKLQPIIAVNKASKRTQTSPNKLKNKAVRETQEDNKRVHLPQDQQGELIHPNQQQVIHSHMIASFFLLFIHTKHFNLEII